MTQRLLCRYVLHASSALAPVLERIDVPLVLFQELDHTFVVGGVDGVAVVVEGLVDLRYRKRARNAGCAEFGGVRALTALRAILAELGTPSIPSAFPVSQIYKTFDNDGNAIDASYNERVVKFLDEYEWYVNALKHGREGGRCVEDVPAQQALCQG